MLDSINGTAHRLARETSASEIAEAALVLPLVFMMLLAVFWFGQAFSIYSALTHAARLGVRAAVAPVCATCAAGADPSDNASNAVQTALQAANLDPNKLQKPSTRPGLCICGSAATSCTGGAAVACDSRLTNICVQGISHSGGGGGTLDLDGVQLSSASAAVGGAGVCGVSVSFQYPYKFWLPGASLNKQQILLRAQAQMRVETQ